MVQKQRHEIHVSSHLVLEYDLCPMLVGAIPRFGDHRIQLVDVALKVPGGGGSG